MEQLEQVFKKIEENINYEIEKLKKETQQKKVELEQKYKDKLEQEKLHLITEYQQKLNLNKKRIYTTLFIEYNKKVEEFKNQILTQLMNKIKQEFLSISRQDYYQLIQSILVKNIFPHETNLIIFDNSGKLQKEEYKKLVNEVAVSLKDNSTKLELVEEKDPSLELGIKIVAGKKKRIVSLETIVELVKPFCEEEIDKIVSQMI
ncbi:MAG: hypothetical protein NZ839_00905 [Endomicrobia bacterium]|nr:hypothetical protein [Endomicrobiia bacterium]